LVDYVSIRTLIKFGTTVTICFVPMARQPLIEAPLSKLDTPHSVGLPRTGDQPDAEHTNTQKKQTSVLPVGFEPAIPANKRRQTHALDCAVTRIGEIIVTIIRNFT
jgi:hypothetical protein